MTAATAYLVFSDLDGSLLDHHSYSFDEARPALAALERLAIPLILVSSKTRAEIRDIRIALGNAQAYIVENGAAVILPRESFEQQPPGTRADGEDWIYETVPGREHWLKILESVAPDYPGQFLSFHQAGDDGVQELTELDPQAASAANTRDYSEPVAWLGDDRGKTAFASALRAAGASVQQGGRFLSVSGDCDKGRALSWLREQYRLKGHHAQVHDLAIGDSANDCAMLEAAATALLIKSPVHDFPALQRTSGVMYSRAEGPAGWSEGVNEWLRSHNLTT